MELDRVTLEKRTKVSECDDLRGANETNGSQAGGLPFFYEAGQSPVVSPWVNKVVYPIRRKPSMTNRGLNSAATSSTAAQKKRSKCGIMEMNKAPVESLGIKVDDKVDDKFGLSAVRLSSEWILCPRPANRATVSSL